MSVAFVLLVALFAGGVVAASRSGVYGTGTISTAGDRTAAFDLPNGNDVLAYWRTGATRRPWVVFVHGGYWRAGSASTAGTADWGQLEVGRGTALFSVGYRLVPKVTWPLPELDVQVGVAWIRSHAANFGLDLSKGFIVGSSAGGQLASIAALDSGEFAGAVSLAGALDPLAAYTTPTNPRLGLASLALLGGHPPDAAPQLWQDARAAAHVGRHRVPFLIMHSRHDPTVSVTMSEDFAADLRAHGNDVSLHVLPGKAHGLGSANDLWLMNMWIDRILAERTR